MNVDKLSATIAGSQFVSEPEMLVDLMQEAHGMVKAAWPNEEPSPECVLSMAKLILFYEEGFEVDEEELEK
ncbi:MAG: hypothetical protein JXB49_30735 [Bacteroidales bacterium]|nr:hypothetical protein [Bacteroidales bacterium]